MFLSSQQQPTSLPEHFATLDDLEPFSRVQLIAFDLDGTLLKAPNETPGDRIRRLQGSAKSFGVRITLATGRTLKGAQNTLYALGDLGAMPIILYNGSLVIEPGLGKVVAHRQIDNRAVNAVLRAAKACDAEIFIYTVDAPNNSRGIGSLETVWYFGHGESMLREYNGMPTVRLATDSIEMPATAILILLPAIIDQSPLISALQFIEGISLTSSGGRYIEIRPLGSSKAAAMQDLCRSLRLQQSNVLAVGDNDNDVELLEWAGIGVSVKGASPAAAIASNYVSRFGAERAAIEVLDLVRRAKRLYKTKR
jgi:Cof subfamily protein (haloacid dehalogenase superfamily)